MALQINKSKTTWFSRQISGTLENTNNFFLTVHSKLLLVEMFSLNLAVDQLMCSMRNLKYQQTQNLLEVSFRKGTMNIKCRGKT